jgi:hypothetical protein
MITDKVNLEYGIVIVGKDDKFKGFLAKNYCDTYCLNELSTSLKFLTEEAVMNFIHYNYSFFGNLIEEGDRLIVIPMAKSNKTIRRSMRFA